MINERYAKLYCCEDISLIENYQAAMTDTIQTWDCHHRWEIDRGLSPEELDFCCEYYYVPADRLIFLTHAEHRRLHNQQCVGEKNPRGMLGKHHSEATKEKMRAAISSMKWQNNGVKNIRARECLDGFVAGRLKRKS